MFIRSGVLEIEEAHNLLVGPLSTKQGQMFDAEHSECMTDYDKINRGRGGGECSISNL